MIFARVIPAADSSCCYCGVAGQLLPPARHYHDTHHHGHTAATRRDLAAWNEANHEFWRRFRSGILDQPVDPTQPFYLNNDRLSLACSSWFFVTNNM